MQMLGFTSNSRSTSLAMMKNARALETDDILLFRTVDGLIYVSLGAGPKTIVGPKFGFSP